MKSPIYKRFAGPVPIRVSYFRKRSNITRREIAILQISRHIYRNVAPVSTHRPETVVSRPQTDFSRVERVDRVESVAPLDAKRPYQTLMF